MDRTASTTIVISIIVLSLLGMVLGWRARKKRQSHLPRLAAVPETLGAPLHSARLFYVATTIADDPLNRVAVSGLGFRARADVSVSSLGIVLDLAGQDAGFIPAADLIRVARATWTIDRVVERDGLIALTWTLGDTAVDSYLRVVEPESPVALIAAIESILDDSTHSELQSESETE
ncbi:MAG: hypothetical protein H7248_08900 [Microbacteriaceae bacterium]|nr:hypothetical protein [Microbacteriaceae bacterium]